MSGQTILVCLVFAFFGWIALDVTTDYWGITGIAPRISLEKPASVASTVRHSMN